MMSTTSLVKHPAMRKHIPALALFGWQLKKNFPFILVATILGLLLQPGLYLSSYFTSMQDFLKAGNHIADFSFEVSAGMCSTFMTIFNLGLSGLLVLLSCINLRYLHSRQSNDFFAALPISRTGLLLSRVAAIYFSAAVPSGFSYGTLAICGVVLPYFTFESNTVLVSLGYTLLFLFAALALTTLLAVCCGHTFDLLHSLLVVNLGWLLLYLLFHDFCGDLLYGYYTKAVLGNLSTLFCPYGRLFLMNADVFSTANPLLLCLFSFLYGCAFLILAILMNLKRKNESASQAYAYRILPIILQIVVSILGGYLLAVIFSADQVESVSFLVFFLIGALLSAVIYNAIICRGFRQLKWALLNGGIAVATSIIVYCCLAGGGFGYVTRIPDLAQVSSVTFSYKYDDSVELTDPAILEAIYQIHANQVKLYQADPTILDIINVSGQWVDEEGDYHENVPITITYHLKSGKQLSRCYWVQLYDFQDQFATILNSKEYLTGSNALYRLEDYQQYRKLEISGSADLELADGSIITYGTCLNINLTTTQLQELLTAYRTDVDTRIAEQTAINQQYVPYELYLYSADYQESIFTELYASDKATLMYLRTEFDLDTKLQQQALQEYEERAVSVVTYD